MKSIKCLLLFVVLIFPVTLVLCQSTGKSKIEAAANDYINKLSIDVELTEVQKITLHKTIVRYFTEQVNAYESNDKQSQKQLTFASDSIFALQFDSILTYDQRKTYEKKTVQRQEQAKDAAKKK